ncbi:MAG TPA: peptidylprolyl isomerase, partial [Acidobacteriota bacterium]
MHFDLRRWLREPLIHFLILGAILFLLFYFVKGGSGTKQNEIVVSSGTVQTISEGFERVWKRPPTQKELDALIQDYIKEEIYSREAIAMGLDRDDTIIRRRLRQKMEFLADGMGYIKEPTEKDLQSYLQKHPEKFRVESRYTFSQVYLNPERHQNSLSEDARQLLTKLNNAGNSVDAGKYGDQFMLGYYFSNQSETNVARTFGDQFAKQLSQLETGKWVGPIESGYGQHLVLITDRTQGRTPPLSEVRKQVQSEWMTEEAKQTSEKFYEGLRSRYTIKIEKHA